MEIENLLDRIIADPSTHAKWLNTLSFLEHVGTRKIHKTQSRPDMTDLILRHASEEARHAHFFKRMADRMDSTATGDYQFDSMLTGYSAYRYFQSLDSMVEKKLLKENGKQSEKTKSKADPFACYLYVTTLIEERAGWLYPIYESRLKNAGSDISLASVIQEEERHLEDMYNALRTTQPDWKEMMDYFLEEEKALFQKYENSLSKKLEHPGA